MKTSKKNLLDWLRDAHALKETAALLKTATGRIDPKWSEVSRVARGGKSWPTDGGPDTLRAMYAGGDLTKEKFEANRLRLAEHEWARV